MLEVLAATEISLQPTGSFGALKFTVPQLVSGAIQLLFIVGVVVFFFMLVIGGIRWILSGGDKTQTEAARNQITAALVGLVVMFAAWAIVQLLGTFFGFNIFEKLSVPDINTL